MSGNLIDLRRRIQSVKNTQKITRAMKTVSAAKLRRSVSDLNKSKPFLEKVAFILDHLKDKANIEEMPFIKEREDGDILLVVISSDKGLCGAYNSNIIKKGEALYTQLQDEGENVFLIPIGNKVTKFYQKHDFPIKKSFVSLFTKINYHEIIDIGQYLQNVFLNESIKKIVFLYSEFVSASQQSLTVKQLFPISRITKSEAEDEVTEIEYILEPNAEAIYESLLPKYINSLIYQIILEASASEHSARMIAMDMATRNADDMIRSLTLTLNKMRQALITKELLEIITATEALNK